MCYDGDYAKVFSEQLVKARKAHRCCECRAQIPVGNRHKRINIFQETEWETFRMHWECFVLWLAVIQHMCGDVGGIAVGGLSEEFGEYGADPVAVPYAERFEAIRAEYTAAMPEGEEG